MKSSFNASCVKRIVLADYKDMLDAGEYGLVCGIETPSNRIEMFIQ